MIYQRFVLAAAVAATVLSACISCAADESALPATVPSSIATTSTSVATTPDFAPPATVEAPTTEFVETYTEPPAVDPVIVDCQTGLGPIVTYWSDGSVTGYIDYCQSVNDAVLQNEVEANTPICDGAACTYPNGAQIANPDYTVVRTPSPWVQGQIDWQNCLDAGNSEEICRMTLN